MSAAKTTGALHVARRYARHGKKVVLIRPARSRRDHEDDPQQLATKNGESFPCFDVASVDDIVEWSEGADVVWLDEPNHFRNEHCLVQIIPKIRKRSIVLVSGLGATSELEPFGDSMGFFLSTADYVEWKTADCDACKNHGTATRSLYVGEAPKDGQLRVGGSESYRPVCPVCWTALMELPPTERRWKLAVDG
jgi:thymidine kinase